MSLAPISQVKATGALGSLLVLHPANSAITQNNNPARGSFKILMQLMC